MPLKKKSFSSQSHLAKNRSGWQRNNKSHAALSGRENSVRSKTTSIKPPLPQADNSAAVHLFLSNEDQLQRKPTSKSTMQREDDKENVGRNRPRVPQGILSRSNSQALLSSQTQPKLPATPAARIMRPELIESSDFIPRSTNSPGERITWAYDGNAINSSVLRGKKRARSSSPISPSARDSSHATINGRSAESTLPFIDPGSELWGKFAENGQATPLKGRKNAMNQLMQGSSPRKSKAGTTPRSDVKLLRARSCGAHWPNNKRRKLAPSEGNIREEMHAEPPLGLPSKGSMINALLEKVVLPNHEPATTLPIQSSPLTFQDNCDTTNAEVDPVLERPVDEDHLLEQPDESNSISKNETIPPDAVEKTDDSSDYGDFDVDEIDDEILSAMDVNATSPPPAEPKPASPPPLPVKEEFSDEFEGDSFDAELVALASQFDEEDDVETKAKMEVNVAEKEHSPKSPMKVQVESDDEFGEDLDDADFEAAASRLNSQLCQHSSLPPPSQKVRAIQRYLVTDILDNEYTTPKGTPRPERMLLVRGENTKNTRCIRLRDGWLESPVSLSAYVHVIGDFKNGECIVDDQSNMIILHPDHLVSATVVADSFGCLRRAVLQDRVKATNVKSPPLVYGTILHEIFQAAMMANRWDTAWLTEVIDSIAVEHIEDLYTIKLEIAQAVEYLQGKMPELQAWAELFVSCKPKPDALIKAGNGTSAAVCISKLLDVEEHVWSPMYGLKGNIDATVQVTMKGGREERTLTIPFEVKTGKTANASHRAQTALYTLLLSDRYDVEIAYGILYYMETSELIRIPKIRHELRHMIMQRNELACYVRQRDAQLPPMLKKEALCNRCYAKVPCFIYHKLADDGTGESSGLREKFDEVVKHLTPTHKEFFLKWDNLLTKEEKESLKFRRELWTMLSSEREKLGRCFSNVIIKPDSAFEEVGNAKINRFTYTLIKQHPAPGFSFIDSQITLGEPIVISDEKGHFALANGYVTHVRRSQITVAVDRRLHNARIRQAGFDEINNQLFSSIMQVAPEASTARQDVPSKTDEPVLYRLDKDEFSNGMATVRNNIIQVMSQGPVGSQEIRDLVVDLKAPRFKPHSTAYTLSDRENINVDQRRAIEKVMSAQDYALVLGMPGTGKTTTIAHIIRALVSQGKSVLLTSYTHTAVDNILVKLKDDRIPILRLGTPAKVHADVQTFVRMANTPRSTFAEIRRAWHETPVVATTCLGINHPLFGERHFDHCIVDEASQITLPVCLGPIRLARTFVLVGDHNQLPPLVQNEEARRGGLDISLFKHLSETHPSSVVNLEHQYRMCADIMSLSNKLIYHNRLKCGTAAVAARRLVVPNMRALDAHHHTAASVPATARSICAGAARHRCWLRDLVEPSTTVAFVNTDPLLPRAREEAKGNRIVNATEVSVCAQLVRALLAVGVAPGAIGLMTHYRAQLALLKHALRAHPALEMHTADRFQGRDKEVVILSLVRSNEAQAIGDLLKDWRRINVAFTRAKTKLLVVGSRDTLRGVRPPPPPPADARAPEEMVAKFVGYMEARGWVYDLPAGALDSHLFDAASAATPASAAPARGSPTRAGKAASSSPRRLGASGKMILGNHPVIRNVLMDLTGHQ